MPTLLDLVVEFFTSLVRLVVVFTTEVALRQPLDPMALVSLAAGTAFTLAATGVFGLLVAGAALDALGVDLPTLGGGPNQRDEPPTPPGRR